MDAALDVAIMIGLVWMLVSFRLSRPKGHPRRVWGELDSGQIVKVVAKRKL